MLRDRALVRRERCRGLEIVPAELHPTRDLRRVTYELADDESARDEGVAALARALEHIHLGWAMVAFLVRLPGVRHGLQLLADVSGGEERLVRRSAADQACAAGLNVPARWTSNDSMPRRELAVYRLEE